MLEKWSLVNWTQQDINTNQMENNLKIDKWINNKKLTFICAIK